jgi:zinc transport system substrate-binding protein
MAKSTICSPAFVTGRLSKGVGLLLAVVLAGCGQAPAASVPIKVVASIAPLADWARNVGGVHASVQLLVPPGVDPRTFELQPEQRDAIYAADVLLINGLGLEPWIEEIMEDARARRLIVAEMSQFTGPLTERVLGRRAIAPDEAVPQPRSGTGNLIWVPAPIYSPYLWLDVASARAQVGLIAQMLGRADPDSMVDFQQNAARYIGELDNLDGSIFRQIEAWRWQVLLSTNRFLFPFARHHGLSISIFGTPTRRRGPPLAQPLFVDGFEEAGRSRVAVSRHPVVPLNPLGHNEYIELMQTMVTSMTTTMSS